MKTSTDIYDGILILLPGSNTSTEAVGCLSEVAGLDKYLANMKLNTKLPLPVCRLMKSEIIGKTGDKLQSCGINFFVIDKTFYSSPFQPAWIKDCRFEETGCRFFNIKKEAIAAVPFNDDILLLEAVYRTNMKDALILPLNPENPFGIEQETKPKISTNIESINVLFLYRQQNPAPFTLLDVTLNYNFLNNEKGSTVAANYHLLKNKLESAFGQKFNRDLVLYSFFLPQSEVKIETPQRSVFKDNTKKAAVIQSSNEEAVHRISRLLYGQWCIEKGWVDRVVES